MLYYHATARLQYGFERRQRASDLSQLTSKRTFLIHPPFLLIVPSYFTLAREYFFAMNHHFPFHPPRPFSTQLASFIILRTCSLAHPGSFSVSSSSFDTLLERKRTKSWLISMPRSIYGVSPSWLLSFVSGRSTTPRGRSRGRFPLHPSDLRPSLPGHMLEIYINWHDEITPCSSPCRVLHVRHGPVVASHGQIRLLIILFSLSTLFRFFS